MRLTPVERLALLDEPDRLYALRRLSMPEKRGLIANHWWHEGQSVPDGDWRIGLILAGRGFGKTRAGAEWVSALARADGTLRIALVGASRREALEVMVRGPTGLMAVARPDEDVVCYADRGLIEFASGAQAFVYSGYHPDGLRGAQHHFAWCDELAKWRHPQETWDNLLLGLRLGEGAQVLVTTTPKPLPLLKRLAADPATKLLKGRTGDNDSLPADFVAAMTDRYAGTRLGRQELDGELIEDFEGALWTRDGIATGRAGTGGCDGPLARVVVGVDPPASASGDACGIVVCGLGADGIGYVLDDRSVAGLAPEGWARAVVAAAEAWEAELVVVETNQGGEMVTSVLRSVDSALPVRPVKARYGKGRRAEPVSALFAKGKAKFAGLFAALEDQLCAMTSGGYEGAGSPDRADAMVWAMAELLLGARAEPRVRRL